MTQEYDVEQIIVMWSIETRRGRDETHTRVNVKRFWI